MAAGTKGRASTILFSLNTTKYARGSRKSRHRNGRQRIRTSCRQQRHYGSKLRRRQQRKRQRRERRIQGRSGGGRKARNLKKRATGRRQRTTNRKKGRGRANKRKKGCEHCESKTQKIHYYCPVCGKTQERPRISHPWKRPNKGPYAPGKIIKKQRKQKN